MIASLRSWSSVQRLLSALIGGCLAFASPDATAAERREATPDTRLFAQEFRLSRSFFRNAEKELVTTLADGSKKGLIDLREWFRSQGVVLPKEGSALYDPEAETLAVTARLADLDAVKRVIWIIDDFGDGPSSVRFRIVLVRALKSVAAEGDTTKIDDLDELKKVSGGKLLTIASVSGTGLSGNRMEVTHDAAVPVPQAEGSGHGKEKERGRNAQWPPPAGIERAWFEAEGVIGHDGQSADGDIHVRYFRPAHGDDSLISLEYRAVWSAPSGATRVVKTFTTKPKDEPDRLFIYALLVTCEIIDADGSVRPRR